MIENLKMHFEDGSIMRDKVIKFTSLCFSLDHQDLVPFLVPSFFRLVPANTTTYEIAHYRMLLGIIKWLTGFPRNSKNAMATATSQRLLLKASMCSVRSRLVHWNDSYRCDRPRAI